MTIQGQVTDYKTTEPLPGASITIFDKNGQSTGQGAACAADGTFNLTSDLLDNPLNRVCFSFVGYLDTRLSPANANGEIGMVPKGDVLGTVVITARRMAKNPNAIAIVVTIAIALVLIALVSKYSKVKTWSVGM